MLYKTVTGFAGLLITSPRLPPPLRSPFDIHRVNFHSSNDCHSAIIGDRSAKDAAMPTSDEGTLLPATSFHPDSMVTLLVGPDEQRMTVHGDRLARSSAYFRAALRQEWLEGQNRTVKLPDEAPEIMQHYIEYVYSGKPPADTLTKKSDFQHAICPHYTLLAELYVLGDRRLDPRFENVIMEELFRLAQVTRRGPGIEFVEIIYQGTTANSPARRMVVDSAANCLWDYWLDLEHVDSEHAEFWRDLSKVLLMKAQNPRGRMKALNKYLVREDA
jgi:hypothetical protein